MKKLKQFTLYVRFFSFVFILLPVSLGLKYGLAHADNLYTISGTVSFGSPAVPRSNATLDLINTSTNADEQTTTDANGNYTLSEVPDGTYDVDLSARSGNSTTTPGIFEVGSTGSGASVTVNGADVIQNFSFNTSTVTVTVRDGSDQLASGAEVELFNTDTPPFTDSSGALTFAADAPGLIGSAVDTNSDGTAQLVVIPE